jgi:hypothetical protein
MSHCRLQTILQLIQQLTRSLPHRAQPFRTCYVPLNPTYSATATTLRLLAPRRFWIFMSGTRSQSSAEQRGLLRREFRGYCQNTWLRKEPGLQERTDKGDILVTSREKLACSYIKWRKAQSDGSSGIGRFDTNQSRSPFSRQNGGLGSDTVSVIAERFMKGREFADASVNQVGPFRVFKGVDVCFHRNYT